MQKNKAGHILHYIQKLINSKWIIDLNIKPKKKEKKRKKLLIHG